MAGGITAMYRVCFLSIFFPCIVAFYAERLIAYTAEAYICSLCSKIKHCELKRLLK